MILHRKLLLNIDVLLLFTSNYHPKPTQNTAKSVRLPDNFFFWATPLEDDNNFAALLPWAFKEQSFSRVTEYDDLKIQIYWRVWFHKHVREKNNQEWFSHCHVLRSIKNEILQVSCFQTL